MRKNKIVREVNFQDVGCDNDDSFSNIHRKWLIDNGYLDTLAVVATLAPEYERAKLAKGELNSLGLGHIPVFVGSRLIDVDAKPLACHSNVPYLADIDEVDLTITGLETLISEQDDKSITFTIQAGMEDFAKLLHNRSHLIKTKAKKVVIMGGVVPQKVGKYLVPNDANNNTFSWSSACYVYSRCQELGIPMTIVTRNAAYACKLDFSVYDVMEKTGHPMGIALAKTQKTMMEHLFVAASSPENSVQRETLPPSRDVAWFANTFCDGIRPKNVGEVWTLVKYFNLYDSVNLFAAFEDFEKYFKLEIFEVLGVKHKVIGLTPELHGLTDVKGLCDTLVSTAFDALNG